MQYLESEYCIASFMLNYGNGFVNLSTIDILNREFFVVVRAFLHFVGCLAASLCSIQQITCNTYPKSRQPKISPDVTKKTTPGGAQSPSLGIAGLSEFQFISN